MNEAPDEQSVSMADDTLHVRRLRNETSGRIADLEDRVARLTGLLAAANRENEMNRDRISQVHKSLSWRLTRPLRQARRVLSQRMTSRRSR